MEQLRVQMFRPDNQLAEEYVLQCKARFNSLHARSGCLINNAQRQRSCLRQC